MSAPSQAIVVMGLLVLYVGLVVGAVGMRSISRGRGDEDPRKR